MFHFKCLWLFASSFLTVKLAFKSKIPCCAQRSKFPFVGKNIESKSEFYFNDKIYLIASNGLLDSNNNFTNGICLVTDISKTKNIKN